MDNWRFGRIHQQWRKGISQHDHWAQIIGAGTTKVGTIFIGEPKVGDKQDYRRQRRERMYPSNSYISIGFSGRLHCPIFDSSFTFQATTRNKCLQWFSQTSSYCAILCDFHDLVGVIAENERNVNKFTSEFQCILIWWYLWRRNKWWRVPAIEVTRAGKQA